VSKENHPLVAFLIPPASSPVVFEKPGQYDVGGGKQRTAFGMGTVYFRHGAKSEPGSTNDVRMAVERCVEVIRKSWIRGVRRIVQAPPGSQIVVAQSTERHPGAAKPPSGAVRVVSDPGAPPVFLTRDASKASSRLVHEAVSEGIFDEINNVVEANRALAKEQDVFFLGSNVYHRIYAEREYVRQPDEEISLLLQSAVTELYAPGLFWMLKLPETLIAHTFADAFVRPRNCYLLRVAVLLGGDFCHWLHGKWTTKWERHPQPPMFYWNFKETIARLKSSDPYLLAAKLKPTTEISLPGEETVIAKDLLASPEKAAIFLSKACMAIFRGSDAQERATARALDYLSYGADLVSRSANISKAIVEAIGDREAGEMVESA